MLSSLHPLFQTTTSTNDPASTDQWFLTRSLIFPADMSSTNLVEELIHYVSVEQQERDRLREECQRVLALVKQRDAEISDRLKLFHELHEELLQLNQMYSVKDLLEHHLWTSRAAAARELESSCYRIIHDRSDGSTTATSHTPARHVAMVHKVKHRSTPVKSNP